MNFEREALRLQLRAVMLAEGRVAQHNSLSRQHPESRPPSMPERATADVARSMLRNLSLSREERIRQVTDMLDREQFGAPGRHEETNQQFAFRIITQYVGVPTAEVARRECQDARRIRAVRQAAGQDSKGMPK